MRKSGVLNVSEIVKNNKLSTNVRDGAIYYDNLKTKDIRDGFYLRIDSGTSQTIKIECNIQKFWSGINTGKFTNYGNFTFSEAKQAIESLKEKTGIELNDFRVNYYEIGVNLNVSKDCREYMDKMRLIGTIENRKELLINPRYKDKRVRISEFYEEIKKVFKVYDKNFEMMRKRCKHTPCFAQTLRIETIQKRVERLILSDLLSYGFFNKIVDQFYNDWRTIQFDRTVIVPKGTHESKVNLAKLIIMNGREITLKKAESDFKKGILTERRHRTIREFIQNDWDSFKNQIKIIQSDEENEFKRLLNDAVNYSRY